MPTLSNANIKRKGIMDSSTEQNKLDVQNQMRDIVRLNQQNAVNTQVHILRSLYVKVECALIEGLEYAYNGEFLDAMYVSWRLRKFEDQQINAFKQIFDVSTRVKVESDRAELLPAMDSISDMISGTIHRVMGYRLFVQSMAADTGEEVLL